MGAGPVRLSVVRPVPCRSAPTMPAEARTVGLELQRSGALSGRLLPPRRRPSGPTANATGDRMSFGEITFLLLVAVPSGIAGVLPAMVLQRVETDLSAFEAVDGPP